MAKSSKYEPMTDEELIAAILREKSQADVQGVNLLSYQREQADRMYAGTKTDGLEPTTNMSSIILNATRPVVTTLTTYLSKIFCSDQETVVFDPAYPEEAEAAKQATKLVNHIIHKENNGYSLISNWVRSAALRKNGVVKVHWDESPVTKFKEFNDITEEEIDIIILELEEMGAKVTVEEKNEEEGYWKLKCTYMKGLPTIELLPPEQFLINEGATSINNDTTGITRYVGHRKLMFRGDIQALFPDVDVSTLSDAAGGDSLDYEYETLNRHASDGTYNYISEGSGYGAVQQLEITESWIKADRNGDGYPEWIHAFTIGNTILSEEEWEGPLPFASFTFFPITNKFYGLSTWDVLKDYHNTRTLLMRSEVDMRVQQNTFRIIADPRFVDQRQLQSGRPGVIPARPGFDPKSVMPIPSPQGSPNTVQLLQLLDREIEKEIGINPLTGAISTDVEKSGNDAAKTSMVIDNASAKVEEYARRFAEEGLREVVWLVFDLLKKNADDTSVKALVDKVTPGVPFLAAEENMDKASLMAKVGLGHLTTRQKIEGLAAIQGMQTQIETITPGAIPLEKKLNLSYEMAKSLGYNNYYDFLPTPEEAQQASEVAAQAAQQQNPLVQLEAAKMQAEIKKLESDTAENIIDAEVKGRKQALDEQKAAAEIAIESTQGRPASIG